ncbi:BnaA03g47390D [Brassica napus]|uniref:BnaA03g47390D protein n=2 Tax=Brassica TaxID=3705 RepID=A0A078IKV4_BRANA|nr:BnaA03g47390D [Brassica napus]
MEEMKARANHLLVLEAKVENLNLMSDLETEEKVRRLEKQVQEKDVRVEKLVEEILAKNKSSVIGGLEVLVGVMVIVLVLIGVVIAYK